MWETTQTKKYFATHENFVTMYERVYSSMVDAKLDTPLDKSEYQFTNRAGRRQDNTDEEATGHNI